jgi:magnesium chelatase subunit I
VETRVEVIRRRDAYENDHAAFMLRWQAEDAAIRDRILTARKALKE